MSAFFLLCFLFGAMIAHHHRIAGIKFKLTIGVEFPTINFFEGLNIEIFALTFFAGHHSHCNVVTETEGIAFVGVRSVVSITRGLSEHAHFFFIEFEGGFAIGEEAIEGNARSGDEVECPRAGEGARRRGFLFWFLAGVCLEANKEQE